jgi:hypothetical protein
MRWQLAALDLDELLYNLMKIKTKCHECSAQENEYDEYVLVGVLQKYIFLVEAPTNMNTSTSPALM